MRPGGGGWGEGLAVSIIVIVIADNLPTKRQQSTAFQGPSWDAASIETPEHMATWCLGHISNHNVVMQVKSSQVEVYFSPKGQLVAIINDM